MASEEADVVCQTSVRKRMFTYEWTINNFSLCGKVNEVRSSNFKFGLGRSQGLWNLELSKANENNERFLYLCFLSMRYGRINVDAAFDYCVYAVNTDGERVSFLAGQFTKPPSKKRIKGKQLSAVKDKLISEDDKLKIVCELETPEIVQVAEGSEVSAIPESRAVPTKNHVSSPFTCDLTLMVEGKAIPVHKNILIAESRIFANLIKKKSKRDQDSVVKIGDFSYETIYEVIAYIYTGTAQMRDRRQTTDLLVAASNYRVRGLKQLCGRRLLEDISIENACDLLLLSDVHFVRSMKAVAVKFIDDHWKEVQETEGWDVLEEKYPKLVTECFELDHSAES